MEPETFINLVVMAVDYGHQARSQHKYREALEHYNNALKFYSVGGYCNPPLLSKILLGRADVYIEEKQYKESMQDIDGALRTYAEPVQYHDEAVKWLKHAQRTKHINPLLSRSCYTTALRFALGDNRLQSIIHGHRALLCGMLGIHEECEDDIKKCRMYNIFAASDLGKEWKSQGIETFNQKNYKTSLMLLQLAEKLLAPSNNRQLNDQLQKDRHVSYNFMACAAWNLRQYSKALQAGKKCYEISPVVNKNEASRWRLKGNEMVKDCKFDHAVECYTLAIKYTDLDDGELRGILHSNRSSAYFRKKQFTKAKEDAEKCVKYRPQWSKSYHRLGSALLEMQQYDKGLDVLRQGLNIPQTPEEQYEIFRKIIMVVTNCKDGASKIKFRLPSSCMQAYLKACMKTKDWRTMGLLFLGGGGEHSHPRNAGGLATGCDVSTLSLSELIKSKTKDNNFKKLLTVLIDHGAPVNGLGDLPPLAVAVNEGDYESAVVLLEKKAPINGLLKSKMKRTDDTPVHTAFRIGLLSGTWSIFTYLMDKYKNFSDPVPMDSFSDTNCKGNSLFHLTASVERNFPYTSDGIDLLKKYNVNPTTKNNNGQTPLNMLQRRKDERYHLIEEYVKSYESRPPKKKRKKNKKNKKDKDFISGASNRENSFIPQERASSGEKSVSQPEVQNETENANKMSACTHLKSERDILRDRIAEAIANLKDIGVNFIDNQKAKEPVNSQQKEMNTKCSEISEDFSVSVARDKPHEEKRPLSVSNVDSDDLARETPQNELEDDSEVLFDNLTWEVECTSEVCKFLKDKRLSPVWKKRIVNIIRQLANGHMRGDLAKRLEGLPKQNDILLFEAKVGKGARILWERAIAFSPRSSNNPELLSEKKKGRIGEIYSDIIRVWDIVLDHDTVPRKIEKIVRSYKRGSSCIIKKQLKGFPISSSCPSVNKDLVSIPNLYSRKDDTDLCNESEDLSTDVKCNRSNKVLTTFFPPGSPENTEYHILKFYAFSNSLVNAVLDDQRKTNVDFPFRVSELEHAVINLKPSPMTSILLLGRSGTGKTTCCLYRLWSNFQNYWKQRTIDEPSLPKIAQFIPREIEGDATASDDGDDGQSSCEEDCERHPGGAVGFGRSSCESSTDSQGGVANQSGTHESREEDLKTGDKKPVYEHLHQAFITKNAVLCTEVQKNFLDLSQACFLTRNHSEYQRSSVNRLDEVEEEAWPLFLCSRDWLLMLDASLPGTAYFPRNENGELQRAVKGWAEEDNHLRLIPDESSEEEDDVKYDAEQSSKMEQERGMDPRREVTYQVFKNELWPKMTKKRKVDYHPTLVWTEICSFIKGSVEALHSENGFITLEEYQTLGRKRAPCFSADRETVYELFTAYQCIKRSRRMFDEADLVYQIYHRLQGHVPEWSIHEVYVDETQDFSQAELSVIVRCCRDPNRLFFTGDTAQSIMRGIAFRFNDLKSLFYYLKASYTALGQQSQVRVPDRVYQLTHNYRSHAGILNMASSVIDLLLHFFPESFDKMKRDQGLFEGPKPVLLKSCSFSDLAVILRGHKRKTSPIEFGAHQVVLVSSDEVRDSLPEELRLALVMTIYEAKGLEFDDVLIYNFFKDSQGIPDFWTLEENSKLFNIGFTSMGTI